MKLEPALQSHSAHSPALEACKTAEPPRLDHPIVPDAPTTGDHILVLDVWRGVAVTALLVGHFAEPPKINCGRLGVEFFFVLSGFLMGRLLFIKRTPLDLFYRRRISRIFPAAYFYLTVMVVLGWSGWTPWQPNLTGVVSCYFFYVNYYIAILLGLSHNVSVGIPADHFWSLCIEEHTYIYLSAVAFVHRRTRLHAVSFLIASFLLCFASAMYMGVQKNWDYYQVYWRSDCRAGSILCGAIAACLSHQGFGSRSKYRGVHSDVLGIGFVLLGVLLNFNKFPDGVKYSLGTIALGLGLLLVSRHYKGGSRCLRPMVWLGTISYSLYIWQQPFYYLRTSGRLASVPALGLALTAGCASYFLIERPIRLYLNSTWGRPAGAPT